MARASRPGGLLPPLADGPEESGAQACGPLPPALRRLRTVLLRLHRERERLLRARDCARRLRALLRLPGPGHGHGPGLPQLCRPLPPAPAPGPPLLRARPAGLAAQRLEAAIEAQLCALSRAPSVPSLAPQLAELRQALPLYRGLQAAAHDHLPGAARPFPPGRVLRLLARGRGRRVALELLEALRGPGVREQLCRRCAEEWALLPGLLGLLGAGAGADGGGSGPGEAGALWSQYWTCLWAACAQSLHLLLGPWSDPRAVAQQLSRALGQASLPRECEKELTSLCHSLLHQSVIWSWDQGFCQALGSALGDQSSASTPSCTAELLQQLFPPLLEALREPRSRLTLWHSPGPEPAALGLCTLQTTLLWFLGRAQQHLAAWAPGPFLLLIQKDLPPLLHEVEALSSLASEGSFILETEQQLGLGIQKLTAQMQFLPEESLSLFYQECHKHATRGFKLHMPQGRYWRLRLCPEPPSAPSEYAGTVVRPLLEPVLQGLQGLTLQAQAPALAQALTAVLGAWLDHILAHGIRFSLQGALQLKQDFGVVKAILEEERWGLSPELRQTLLALGVFQQLDAALLCLLQQPLPRAAARRRHRCCICQEVQTTELTGGSLHSLENLAPPWRPGTPPARRAHLPGPPGGGGPSPQAYLAGTQQAWLALRTRQHSGWRLPFLSCLGTDQF